MEQRKILNFSISKRKSSLQEVQVIHFHIRQWRVLSTSAENCLPLIPFLKGKFKFWSLICFERYCSRHCSDSSVTPQVHQITNKQGLPPTPQRRRRPSLSSRQLFNTRWALVAVAVPVVVVDAQQLCHNLQDIVIVFLQQPQVQLPVAESHFKEMGHQGCCLIFRNDGLCSNWWPRK